MKKISFLVPIYPPHFEFAKNLFESYQDKGYESQADFWFVFTDAKEASLFTTHDKKIVLPLELRIFENGGIINIKKLYGLQHLAPEYEFVIILDAETLFIKNNANLAQICVKYFEDKILLGNKATDKFCYIVQQECRKYYLKSSLTEIQNNKYFYSPLYLWYNQLCIYKSSTLENFWQKINYQFIARELNGCSFDYYIYMYYLLLYEGFTIKDTGITALFGAVERTKVSWFGIYKYKKLPYLYGIFSISKALKTMLPCHSFR